ncbi:hypothetical protein MMC30_002068 [Trapelia coarctata]|nr:hypothetical protein [Trapelia coarctata]
MAPRRGGGSSSGSGVSIPACDYCNDITELYGFNLTRFPQETAGLAFACIVLAGFLILFIMSLIGKGTLARPNVRRATKFGLSSAICFFLISQAFSVADSILHDTFAEVMRVYYITGPISDAFYFGADTILPWTILCFIWIRLRALHGDTGIVKGLRGTAIGFLSVLTALFVAIIAIDITLTVYIIDWNYYDEYDALVLAYFGLYITHIVLRCLIGILAIALAVKLYTDSRAVTMRSRIPNFLLGLVTPWFFLREIITLGFVVTNYRRAYNGDFAAYNLARQLSYGIVSLIVYTGLVLCLFRPEWRYVEVEPHLRKESGNSTQWNQPGIMVH